MWAENIHLLKPGMDTPGPARVFGEYSNPTIQCIGGTTQLEVSNFRGTTEEIPDDSWENWEGSLAEGVHTIPPGPRWIRVASGSADEVILSARGGV